MWCVYRLEVREQINIRCCIWSSIKDCFSTKKMSWILTSFVYFFQMPCVCIFLRLKSLPFLSGIAASRSPPQSTAEPQDSALTELLPFGICDHLKDAVIQTSFFKANIVQLHTRAEQSERERLKKQFLVEISNSFKS